MRVFQAAAVAQAERAEGLSGELQQLREAAGAAAQAAAGSAAQSAAELAAAVGQVEAQRKARVSYGGHQTPSALRCVCLRGRRPPLLMRTHSAVVVCSGRRRASSRCSARRTVTYDTRWPPRYFWRRRQRVREEEAGF